MDLNPQKGWVQAQQSDSYLLLSTRLQSTEMTVLGPCPPARAMGREGTGYNETFVKARPHFHKGRFSILVFPTSAEAQVLGASSLAVLSTGVQVFQRPSHSTRAQTRLLKPVRTEKPFIQKLCEDGLYILVVALPSRILLLRLLSFALIQFVPRILQNKEKNRTIAFCGLHLIFPLSLSLHQQKSSQLETSQKRAVISVTTT